MLSTVEGGRLSRPIEIEEESPYELSSTALAWWFEQGTDIYSHLVVSISLYQ